jgi:radical SAM superfamily enzyme YgiQ (UPF0313 family)
VSRAPRIVLCYRADDPDAGDVFSRIVPYGVMTIHGYLRSRGFDSRLHNFTGRSFAEVRRTFAALQPAAIGVSHFTFNHASAVGLYAAAAEAAPDALVLAGGPQATHLDAPILARAPGPQVIVRGEGEGPALAIVEQLASATRRFEEIPGLSWIEGGELRRTPEAPPAEDLDPFHPPERYEELHGVAPGEQFPIVITSRGCPAACTFCNTPLFWGRQMRYRSAAGVVDEIELVWKRHGIDFFSLRDDTFTAKKSRVKQLADELQRRGIFVLWNCQSRVNLVDEERLLWMRRAGCDQVQFGVEAASPAILKELNKEIRPDQIERALALCRKIGIKTSAYFITGVPGQTDADLEANRRLFETAGLMDGIVAPLAYYPGTSLFDEAKARGDVDEELFLAGDPSALFVRRDPHAERQFRKMVGAIEREAPKRGFKREEIEAHLVLTGRCYASLLDLGAWHQERREWRQAQAAYAEIVARWPESPWGRRALDGLVRARGRATASPRPDAEA